MHNSVLVLVLLAAAAAVGNCSSCGPSVLNGSSGEFTSHEDFGKSDYPNNYDCTWTITVPEKQKAVKAIFLEFRVENAANCRFDSLNAFDGNSTASTRLARLCGSQLPPPTMSSGPSLTFRFTTDRSRTDRGFRVRWVTAVPPLSCNEDEFQCRDDEKCIPRSQRCNGRIDCRDESDEQHCGASCGYNAIPHHVGNGFVVGGRDARPGSWPWQAQMLRHRRHHCGGTLLNSRWIVTAAHCLEGTSNPRSYQIILGGFSKMDADRQQVEYEVSQLISHPLYSRRTIDYDIALMKVSKEVEFNDRIFPACFDDSEVDDGASCYTTGWGATQGTPHAEVLKQALLPLWPNERCNQARHYNGRITDRMLCAGFPEGGHDACQGDSGGPLVCERSDGLFRLVGVTSWGSGCARVDKPGVYARVSALHNWLLQQMESNS